jgi:hypothetical protein
MAIEEAEKIAEANQVLLQKLRTECCVEFKFQKIDGSIRTAKGTLKADILPEIKGSGRIIPIDQQVYYDIDKKSFRSYKKSKLIID